MVTSTIATKYQIWNLLGQIADPDIPVLSIVDLGLLRHVEVKENEAIIVTISPSYFGCPAMSYFTEEIKKVLEEEGFGKAEVKISLSPAWTTDWLSPQARDKMKSHGIAPPESELESSLLFFRQKEIACPRCGKSETHLISQFGSTPCKALWYCDKCDQPFEYFKCH